MIAEPEGRGYRGVILCAVACFSLPCQNLDVVHLKHLFRITPQHALNHCHPERTQRASVGGQQRMEQGIQEMNRLVIASNVPLS
jgi:hypothetical protein